jgi:hypothetical protein
MKQTDKYAKGKFIAQQNGISFPYRVENEELYAILEKNGFWWNGKSREWEKEATRPSTTIFADKNGEATGIMRLRLMCHPDETQWLIDALHDNPHFTVIEVSEKTYANRYGAGERAYITIKRDK